MEDTSSNLRKENFNLNIDDKLEQQSNISFFSRLFFLWTLPIMKLSNSKKLNEKNFEKTVLFNNKSEENKFKEDFNFIKAL